MIDLHCHILPGLDDGPDRIEESLAMAEDAIADGITHVVATPHASEEYSFDFAAVRRLRDELQERLGDRLILATGSDFHLNPENIAAIREDAARFSINQRNYLLVEFNEFSIPPWMDRTLHELQLAGLRPIITHPERNTILRTQTDRLRRWVSLGSAIQVTANALTGTFGSSAQKDAMRWIGEGIVHFVSSDAHNTRSRPLKLRAAYEVVAGEFGVEKAEALFHDNPLAAWEGRDLPHVPDLVTEIPAAKRKRFFFF
jgi:protein-tyrosine phosphatase